MINAKQANELRDIIHLRIDCLLVLIDENASTIDPVAGNRDTDNMFESPSSTVKAGVIINAERELTQLTRTLTWLDSEESGYCQKCRKPIPFQRLKTIPTLRLCERCAKTLNGD